MSGATSLGAGAARDGNNGSVVGRPTGTDGRGVVGVMTGRITAVVGVKVPVGGEGQGKLAMR